MISKKFLLPLSSFFALASCSHKAPEKTTYQGLGTESLPAQVLQKFAPPPVDAQWLGKVQKMLDIRGVGSGVVTPDGKSLFYSWGVTGTAQVWKMTGPLSLPQQMTAGQDSTFIATILPNGSHLVLSRDRNGEENPGIYLQSVTGGELREVFHRKGVQARVAYVTGDSKTIYFMANTESADSYAIHKYDIASGKSEVVFKEPGTWYIADVRQDQEFLLGKATGSLWSEYSLWDPKTGKITPLLGQNEREEYDMSFAAAKGEFLVQTPKFGEFRRLYRWKDGNFTPLTSDVKMDLSSYMIDQARLRIYLTWNESGFFKTDVIDARTFKKLPELPIKNSDQLTVSRVSRDGRYAVYSAEDGQSPRSLYVQDWKAKSFKMWIQSSSPEVDTKKFSRAKLEFYPARDGTQIPMLVRRPTKCEPAPCPVIVNFHGGPEGQSTPGFSPYIQSFVDAGFIFVEPNVRGSDGYGKSWLAADDGVKRLKVITDIEDAATFAKKHFAANGKAPKMGVMGGSYGGYSTLYAMTKFAGAYDAGVASVGMSNLVSFLNNTASYRRHLRISEYGDPARDKEALIELSPITHIDRTKGPLLIIQGVNDPRVPAGEAVQMQEKLQAKGLASELILYADEGHGSAKRDNRANQLGHTLRFFEKHLK